MPLDQAVDTLKRFSENNYLGAVNTESHQASSVSPATYQTSPSLGGSIFVSKAPITEPSAVNAASVKKPNRSKPI
jgi:hypothetical protein